ncbi:putative LPS assembly protein LptD [Aurantibacillus circumpalustris]|uniref:putative LPS assembly protein LptD n=1 Tax=Aurantibacillus circumpalustris TaxID=3036359 RepID=UPI00295B5EB3|nr:putative LPS assembly protein LptD [Aurantibacillus circumpalustris]
MSINGLNAQALPSDTLKKVTTDTLVRKEDTSESIDEPIKYSAEDSIVALPQQGKALLYGKARVDYGGTTIEAQFIEIDYTKNLILAYGSKDSTGKPFGNPVFKDNGETMEADKIMYNLKSKKGKIYNALTKQGELLVIGSEIKKDSLNNIYFKDMRCLPCQEADARTAFRAKKAKAIPDDKIVTGPMFLEIGNIPTPLGLPFGYFPNTKKQANGILLPTFGTSQDRGINLRNGGYYLGINDKTDMIIRGDIYANGTWLLTTNNNYNIRYKSSGAVNLSYSSLQIGDKDIPKTYRNEVSYTIGWLHTQDNKRNPSIRFSANVNYRKNQIYNRFNAINTGQYVTNTYQSNINFTKTFKLSSLSINATHSQNSQSQLVEITFPKLTFNVNRFYPFKRAGAVKQSVIDKIGISYLLETENRLSGKDSTIFKGSPLDSMQYGLRHSLPISTNFNILKYITATPAINLSSVLYTKSISKTYTTQPELRDFTVKTGGDIDTVIKKSVQVPVINTKTNKDLVAAYEANFTTAFNTKVYFDYLFKKGKLKQVRHLLIPTLTYGYRPDFGDPKYTVWKNVQYDTLGNKTSYSIFEKSLYGGPRRGKESSLTLNLNNVLEAKLKQKTDTGTTFKKVTLIQGLGINGSYNFAADSFKMSVVGVSLRTVLFKYFDINVLSSFDPYTYNKISKTRVNQFVSKNDGRVARFTSGSLVVSTSIGSNMIEAIKKTRQPTDQTNGVERGAKNDLNNQETMPWNLRIGYNLNLSNPDDRKIITSQLLNFSGDLMPTKFWKVGISSGFDFNTQKLSYTKFDIYRDLKCWEARIEWIPFGPNKSYNLVLNLKTAMLSDFKIPKRSIPRFDNDF